jgi:hypothetical protein
LTSSQGKNTRNHENNTKNLEYLFHTTPSS